MQNLEITNSLLRTLDIELKALLSNDLEQFRSKNTPVQESLVVASEVA